MNLILFAARHFSIYEADGLVRVCMQLSIFEQLDKWKKDNPADAARLEALLEKIEKLTAFTYEPLALPYIEIKTTAAIPSIQL